MFLFQTLLALGLFVLSICGYPDQASFAANTGSATGQQNPVAFDAIFINEGASLDQSTWRLDIATWGLFLVTLTVGHPGAGGHTNYSLQHDGALMTSIYAGSASGARDNTLGLDIVSFFNQHDELHIRSDSTNLVSTSTGKLTSWGIVSLSHEMGIYVGFGVARTTSNTRGQITFNQIWANVGNSWDVSTNTFVAPINGIYFFSFSMGLPTINYANVQLYVNGNSAFMALRNQILPYKISSIGRSVMLHLVENDRVTIHTDNSGYSDASCLTTFSGFLYNSLRQEQFAWAVYRTSNHYGSADPLVYDHVEVTEGGAWANNRAFCLKTGLYYVHISTGVVNGYPAQLTIMKGSLPQGELRRVTTQSTDSISRSMIIQCNAGETLRVVVSSGSGVSSSESVKSTAFIGFYLFA